MKIDWHKVHTYTGDKIAIVENAGSRLRRVFVGAKAAKTRAERKGLRKSSLAIGNMQGEFGVVVKGALFQRGFTFKTVEAAYIAGCYSQKATGSEAERLLRIQRAIRDENRGLTVKRHWRQALRGQYETTGDFVRGEPFFREALKKIRKDWSEPWHYEWMLFLFWSKIEQNPDFARRIRAIPKPWKILEAVGEDNASPDWGCKEIKPGVWQGQNHFGVIAMECRDAIRERRAPDIDWEGLNRRGIYLFGKQLILAAPKPLPKEFYSALASERQKAHCREAGKASAKARAESFGTVAATLGAKGGKVKSAAKAEAARRNIAKAIAARKAKAAAKRKA